MSEAIAQSGNQAINYFIAQEYTKAVAKFATSPNAKTILFPVEATQLIGSLGGIGELVRDVVTPGTPAAGRGAGAKAPAQGAGTPLDLERKTTPAGLPRK